MPRDVGCFWEGQSTSGLVVAKFSDSDGDSSTSDFTATIDWGDGSSETATVNTDANGGLQVVGQSTHAYAEEGTYNVCVTVTDTKDGDVAYACSTAQVADADLTVTANAITASAGAPFGGTVGTCAGPNSGRSFSQVNAVGIPAS
jgi:hypothetical protein